MSQFITQIVLKNKSRFVSVLLAIIAPLVVFPRAQASVVAVHVIQERVPQLHYTMESGNTVMPKKIQAAPEGVYALFNGGLLLCNPETGKAIKQMMLSGQQEGLFVQGNVIYLAMNDRLFALDRKSWQKLAVYDIRLPNGYPPRINDVRVEGDVAFLASYDSVVFYNMRLKRIIKILPMPGSNLPNAGHTDVWSLALDGPYLFVTYPLGGQGVLRYDLMSGKVLRFQHGSYRAANGLVFDLPETPKGIAVYGGKVFVCDEFHGLAVFNELTGALLTYIQWPWNWTQAVDVKAGHIFVENATLPIPF